VISFVLDEIEQVDGEVRLARTYRAINRFKETRLTIGDTANCQPALQITHHHSVVKIGAPATCRRSPYALPPMASGKLRRLFVLVETKKRDGRSVTVKIDKSRHIQDGLKDPSFPCSF
jgi:hypothetical protein